jgi:PAS domain S-box-containing protein
MRNKPIKVLLIEDSPEDVLLVKEMFAEASTVRFELTHIDRLGKAFKFPDRESFDIILLDLSLPDVHGLDTVVQTQTALPAVPIVVMSGLGDEELAVKALHEGAQDYLVKGQVDSSLLIRSMRYAIERKQSEEALRKAHDELELRVHERTEELIKTNEALMAEIAERRKTEEALQRSEKSLTKAQKIAHLGNWDWNIQTNELRWSDEIYRIFGLTPQQFGATYDEFLNAVHPEDREYVKKSVLEALYGKPYSIEHRIVLPDSMIRFVHEEGEVTFGESGEPVRMLGTVQDITEKKEKEIQLIMSERLAALGQMASGIAHEINNPLATIGACAEGLLARLGKGRIDHEFFKSYLEMIYEEVMRCKGITTSMLSFVRRTSYEKKDIDIHHILDKTLDLIGFQGRLKYVEIIKKYKGVLVVHGSEGELRQVFLAIFVNALDAMEDKGILTIETGIISAKPDTENGGGDFEPAVREFIFIKVSDTGPGIPSELQSRILAPFFTTKSEKGGIGLGLSIADKIIKNHNGSIQVVSDAGKSTTFQITLPK